MKNILLLLLTILVFSSCAYQKGLQELESMDDLSYPYEVKKVMLSNDIEIAYVDEGKGKETIVFIHGLGSYLPAWKMNIDDLRTQYRCIALDLPGYGKSSKGKYEGSMTFFAGIVKEFVEKLNLGKVTLAGHSMGGQISIVAALGYPEIVEKLILVAPAGFETFHKGQKDWFRNVFTPDLVKYTSVDQIRENLGYNFYRFPMEAEFMITDRIEMRTAEDFEGYCYIIPKCVQGMVNEPVYDYLPDVNQPTLVVFGENDNLIPNRFLNGGPTETYARQGAEKMPNAQLLMVPQAGHFVHFEKADKVNEAVSQFLSSQ
jgi:pimeloyl-ACP methyl ester carboxylesterase